MCAVSFVGDDWSKNFPGRWPNVPQSPVYPIPQVSRAEFDALKAEVEALKRLLAEAKRFDEATGQKDCEMEQKIDLLKKIAQAVGVDLADIFPAKD